MAALSFGRKYDRLIDMFSAVFSNQLFHLKRSPIATKFWQWVD